MLAVQQCMCQKLPENDSAGMRPPRMVLMEDNEGMPGMHEFGGPMPQNPMMMQMQHQMAGDPRFHQMMSHPQMWDRGVPGPPWQQKGHVSRMDAGAMPPPAFGGQRMPGQQHGQSFGPGQPQHMMGPMHLMGPPMHHQRHHSVPYAPPDSMIGMAPMSAHHMHELSHEQSPTAPSPRPFVTSPEGGLIYGTLPYSYKPTPDRQRSRDVDKVKARKSAGTKKAARRPELRDSLFEVNGQLQTPDTGAGAEMYETISVHDAPYPGYPPWLCDGVGQPSDGPDKENPVAEERKSWTKVVIDRKVRHAYDERSASRILH